MFFRVGIPSPDFDLSPREFPPLITSSGGGWTFSHFSPVTAQYSYILVNLFSKTHKIPQNFLARAFRALACFSSCSMVVGLWPKSREIRDTSLTLKPKVFAGAQAGGLPSKTERGRRFFSRFGRHKRQFGGPKTMFRGGTFSHFSPGKRSLALIWAVLVSETPQITEIFLARALRALVCYSSYLCWSCGQNRTRYACNISVRLQNQNVSLVFLVFAKISTLVLLNKNNGRGGSFSQFGHCKD